MWQMASSEHGTWTLLHPCPPQKPSIMSPTGLRLSLPQRSLPRSLGVACSAAKPLLVSALYSGEVPAPRLVLIQFMPTAIKPCSQLFLRHIDLHGDHANMPLCAPIICMNPLLIFVTRVQKGSRHHQRCWRTSSLKSIVAEGK